MPTIIAQHGSTYGRQGLLAHQLFGTTAGTHEARVLPYEWAAERVFVKALSPVVGGGSCSVVTAEGIQVAWGPVPAMQPGEFCVLNLTEAAKKTAFRSDSVNFVFDAGNASEQVCLAVCGYDMSTSDRPVPEPVEEPPIDTPTP